MEPSALSLLPALVAIGLAFATRRALPALFASVVVGSLVLFMQTGDPWDLDFVRRFLIPSIASEGYARILLIYLWCLGGLTGLWAKTGGALHFAELVGERMVRGPRSALAFTWLLGTIFHQGGTVSTVLLGTTARPLTDAHDVSHEELAYVVDSTGSPIATVLPFNAWPAYVAGLAVGTVPILADVEAAELFFFQSVWANFYGIFAVLGTLLFALGVLPAIGPMRAAVARSRETGALDAAEARPLLQPDGDQRAAGYTPSLLDFGVPVGTMITLAIVPYLLGVNFVNEAFAASVLSAMLVALIRGMSLEDVLDGFITGCRSMTIGALVLGLAVTLGTVSKDLGAATYLVAALGDAVPAVALPGLLTALCMGIAFSTGTSWGTYAVVFPIALPLAWALAPDPVYLQVCFGAVLGGSVFGDQCSPISDTSILSSMFSGCDLMDHVRTQLPLALAAAGVGAVASTLAAAWVL